MDPATVEQYADWLDELEKSDPKAYAQFIQEMQAKMQGVADPANMMGPPTTASGGVPDQLKFPGNKVMQTGGIEEQKEGMYVDVTPGFVMKTLEQTSKTKLFVNICSSEYIQIFSKKKKLDENGDEQEGIHVPLSLGPPHEVVDHAEKTCLAIDIAVNPGVLDDCNNDMTFRNFVCELAIEYIQEKYKFRCDPQYKLPKLTYRGSLPPPRHYIRKTQTPVIEEVSRSTPPPPPKELQTATLRLFENSIHGDVCEVAAACEGGKICTSASLDSAPSCLLAVVDLPTPPPPETRDGIDVQVNEEYLVVLVRGYHELARVLPYPIQVQAVTASLVGSSLTITLPVNRSWQFQTSHADTGSSPWMLAQALAQDDAPEPPPKAVDRFHLLRDATSSPGTTTAVQEDEILPEDRFHQHDMMSMHILDQRRRDKEQKADKASTEHAARKQEAEKKRAAATAAGKTWAEMYPNEPETTFVDWGEMINDAKAPPPVPLENKLLSEAAKATAARWKQERDAVPLKSSLAFELLD
ncbi:Aste57867_2022 [Aphanomyces stellatus]|uniref:Aste57867_2022 protein n=1 Tax=Aphanomyces stellatus TaxID=120398 RepID=A0A485K6I3_9STRA|nr:hypothetical protein As57867_002019 [Aphanomyces stellatus]VFT79226.1 Aste57867_2022 [Aphanomyces stellatus]